MEDKMIHFKAAVTALLTALSHFLGWKGILVVVWLACMVLDYVSGSMAACKEGSWCSKTAREGIFHKGGMILVVLVSVLADLALAFGMQYLELGFAWPGILLPLVLCWYIITEIGSILENAVKMGAAVPEWLVKLMKVSLQAVDKLGNAE